MVSSTDSCSLPRDKKDTAVDVVSWGNQSPKTASPASCSCFSLLECSLGFSTQHIIALEGAMGYAWGAREDLGVVEVVETIPLRRMILGLLERHTTTIDRHQGLSHKVGGLDFGVVS